MGIAKRLMILSISFSLILFPAILANHDACEAKKCSPDGPAVRFPFVLLGKQPENCGYNSSFNLHCDELNRTILLLSSSSTKVAISDISYSSQTISPEATATCGSGNLDDAFAGPFHDYVPYFRSYINHGVGRYTLFNCSSTASYKYYILIDDVDCREKDDLNRGYNVFAAPTDSYLGYFSKDLEFCTKMYDTNLTSPIVFVTGFSNLSWSLPECRKCEVRGGICRWKQGTTDRIGCLGGNRGILKILRILGPILGCILLILAIGKIILLCYKMEQQKKTQKTIRKFLEDYAAMKPTRYSYAEIRMITNDFRYKLGGGGYGNVFKGQISNKIFVAVKLLHNSTGNGEEFITEVGTMGTIHHVNVVRLLGFCADGYKKALVYEFLLNGSLDKFIFSNDQEQQALRMGRLQEIAVGIARGIEYLHQGCEHRILHFDIKPHNILLDENFNPKIADFGLAKLCEKGKSIVSMTAARGTMGYIAPEVFSRHFGNVSFKSDIFSFGMLLLEMVGRRKNIDATVQNVSQVYFPEWVYGRLVDGEELIIQAEEDGEDQIAKKLAIVGLWCIQWNPVDRPSIRFVLQMLQGNGENLSLPANPFTSRNGMNPPDPNEHKRPFGTELTVISELV